MKFIEVISNKKFTLISIFLFTYVLLNLLDGERGLISYLKKKNIEEKLLKEQKVFIIKLSAIESKNNLLSGFVDKDYLEILYRKKFMIGKKNEKVFIQ